VDDPTSQFAKKNQDTLSRNLVLIRITPQVFLDMLSKPQCFSPVNPLPVASQIVGKRYDSWTDTFELILYHPSFEAVPAGAVIPYRELTLASGPCVAARAKAYYESAVSSIDGAVSSPE
jgi:hypothetical protein